MILALFVTVMTVMSFLIASIGSMPWHASCKVKWEIPMSCNEIKNNISNQFNVWENASCPGISETCPEMPCGQKCKYKLLSDESGTLRGWHATPAKSYYDDLTFTFDSSSSNLCSFEGFSTARTWYAILDWGTNYCNLFNLLEGAGLTQINGFKEETDDSICTQYSSRNCERY